MWHSGHGKGFADLRHAVYSSNRILFYSAKIRAVAVAVQILRNPLCTADKDHPLAANSVSILSRVLGPEMEIAAMVCSCRFLTGTAIARRPSSLS